MRPEECGGHFRGSCAPVHHPEKKKKKDLTIGAQYN
jgi:hypothetical protein